MKTIKTYWEGAGPMVRRVSDHVAYELVHTAAGAGEGWEYCPKSVWKLNVRDIGRRDVSSVPVILE